VGIFMGSRWGARGLSIKFSLIYTFLKWRNFVLTLLRFNKDYIFPKEVKGIYSQRGLKEYTVQVKIGRFSSGWIVKVWGL
jgi:hypothetical protein